MAAQARIDRRRPGKVSRGLAGLPGSEKGAEIVVGNKGTKQFAPLTSGVEIGGFDRLKRPYLSVSAEEGGAYTVVGTVPLFPSAKGFVIPKGLPADDLAQLQDVNASGSAAITIGANFPYAEEAVADQVIPLAYIYRAGKWIEIGRADDLKINDQGTVAGITRVKKSPSSLQGAAFLRVRGKNRILGPANHLLLNEAGDVLCFDSWSKPADRENQINFGFEGAFYYSKGRKQVFKLKKGLVPVAMWSKHRFIAHDKSDSELFYLYENGKSFRLDRLANLSKGYWIGAVRRVYSDGRIWVSLYDAEGSDYDAFLVPRKR
jgi:hypothetical protein